MVWWPACSVTWRRWLRMASSYSSWRAREASSQWTSARSSTCTLCRAERSARSSPASRATLATSSSSREVTTSSRLALLTPEVSRCFSRTLIHASLKPASTTSSASFVTSSINLSRVSMRLSVLAPWSPILASKSAAALVLAAIMDSFSSLRMFSAASFLAPVSSSDPAQVLFRPLISRSISPRDKLFLALAAAWPAPPLPALAVLALDSADGFLSILLDFSASARVPRDLAV